MSNAALGKKLSKAFAEQRLQGACDLMMKVNNLLERYPESDAGTKLDIGTTMENHVMQLRHELEEAR